MLTNGQLTTLITEIQKPAYAANLAVGKYQAVADTLNARTTVANTPATKTRPKRVSWDAFQQLLAAADVLKLYGYGSLAADLKAANETGNDAVRNAIWRGLKTALTAPSITAVEAEFAKTENDPTWPATVQQPSIAMGLGLPTVTADDVRTAARRMAGG